MKIKVLSAIFLATTVTFAPRGLHAEMSQPLLVANAFGMGADDASLYADGTRAINESRWSDAAGLFDRVAQMHGEHAEGALYWKAYAENKEGQSASALGTCGELRKGHPKSRWVDECGALEIEIRGKSGDPVAPQTEPDENLKLLAINALMQQDQAQAILQKTTGNQSEELQPSCLCWRRLG
jgi:outer membrane protein assembly factor BamD (BamD/ComL family)